MSKHTKGKFDIYETVRREEKCPGELFLKDLKSDVTAWKGMGDGIVLLGDFNQDVRSKEIEDWKQELGLEDKLLERVANAGVQLNTYTGGHAPIDTILCTQGIEVTKSGYLAFGEGVGDHRHIYRCYNRVFFGCKFANTTVNEGEKT